MSTTVAGPEGRLARLELRPPVIGRAPRRRFRTPPRLGTSLAVSLGAAASLSPGLLPRTATAQAILTALLVTLAFAVAGALRALTRRRGFDINRELPGARMPVALTGTLVVSACLVRAQQWQNDLRAAMGVPAVSLGHWGRCAVGAALIVLILVGTVRGLRWCAGRIGRRRSAGLVLVAALSTQFVLLPTAMDRHRFVAVADANSDSTLTQPLSMARSGSAASVVGWDTLGAEGRKFVAGTVTSRAVRTYVGLDSAPDLESRVALAIRELERSGGFERAHLVVTVPTGSGWIDSHAADGLERRFGGDVALVGLQYSAAPSWATFVFGRSSAEDSARALFTAVERRIATLAHRPRLYVYGQSLGATAGSAIFADEADQQRRVCAALWAGPPAGRVHRAGATVLANSSDPVVQWTPELLWRAPDLTGTRPDAPHPHWLPVLGFIQTTADLLTALGPPPGHGHRYGTDQGTALGSC